MPAWKDLIVYQFHVGTFFGPNRENRVAKFLDVLDRIEYLADLGVNAIEPLPIVECRSPGGMGYDPTDFYSAATAYQVTGSDIDLYLPKVNRLFSMRHKKPLAREQLAVPINQLKTMVDVCHLWGIALILDVVYNRASARIKSDSGSLWFFDRQQDQDPNHSLYFTEQTDLGGPSFAVWKAEVRSFLIDNALFFLREYHLDGFRYDGATVIDRQNPSSGWRFFQNLNDSVRALNPSAINIAEFWGPEPAVTRPPSVGGAGFDASWHNGLRSSIRSVISQASRGSEAAFQWQPVVDQLSVPGFADRWRAIQHIEDADVVYRGRDLRIPMLADSSNPRSWYARSRSRVALGLLLTAPGIPSIFMGQEFLEDRQWSAGPPATEAFYSSLISWDGFANQKEMDDFYRFARELIWLRRKHPALRGEGIATPQYHNVDRVLVFQRWVENVGRDIVVVASLNEAAQHQYRIPFPARGEWIEALNSDIYDHWVNPSVKGNGHRIIADGPSLHSLETSAIIVVPANSIVVFTRDTGDF